ncbi:MAG: hypothetical protein P8175_02440 [Deltaproteobacteria bacterium]|jgi:hypothetical protein
MEKILYNEKGKPVAYIASDYRRTIYLWDGLPVGYLYEEQHVYGANGRHLGWFRDDILYNNHGEMAGFTDLTCPVSIAKGPPKKKKAPPEEIRPRWKVPKFPKFGYKPARKGLAELLRAGQVSSEGGKALPQAPED